MDGKLVGKPEQLHQSLDERKRDRGDNLKKKEGVRSKLNDALIPKLARKAPSPDQGDVPIINKATKTLKPIAHTKSDKFTNDKDKRQHEIRSKVTVDVTTKINAGAEKNTLIKAAEVNYAVFNKTRVGERNLSDKVTSRAKVLSIQSQGKDTKNSVSSDLKADPLKKQTHAKFTPKDIIADSTKPDNVKAESDIIKKEKDTSVHRKPIIKTVKSKNDNRVYKAVTFTEQKRTKPTVLEINIPNVQAKKIKTKLVDKNLEAKPASVQGTSKLNIKANSQYSRRNRLTERIKRKKLNRCISSPDKFKKADSPPTEVAKWAPSCLNTHTKPYYEAWVNTTLAAISKISKKDKLFLEKQNIIETFQKSLELGTESPDLVHENYANECYTGKIKIKQKNLSKRTRQPLIKPLIDINK